MGSRALLVAPLLLTLAWAQVGHGHEPPYVRDVVFRQGAGPVLVSNRGLMLGDGERGPFRLACAAALSTGIGARYDVIATEGDVLYVGTSGGLLRSADGCSFEPVPPFDALLLSALAQAPDDRATFYVAAYDATRGGFFVTHDAGATFTQLVAASESEFVTDVRVAPSRPARVYVAGESFGGAESALYLDRSDDAGESFTRIAIRLLPTEGDFELLDVAPDDPDALLARAVDDDATAMLDRLLVSRDGGQTWSSPLRVRTLESARFGESSTSVWVAGYEGLWRSTDGAASFQQVPSATRMSTAFERDGHAWLCGYYDGQRDGIGWLDASGAMQPYFDFAELTSQVSCSEGAETLRACVSQWDDWQNEQLYGYQDGGVLDAGLLDASTTEAGAPDAGVPSSSPEARSGGGCALVRDPAAGGARTLLATCTLLTALVLRRRRAR